MVQIPVDGFVGAFINANFYLREIWYAPAGWKQGLLPVAGLSRIYDLPTRDYLYQNAINAVRFKPNRGAAIWGQKTLQFYASATDRINVRFALIEIEEALEEVLEDFEFQFNDHFTRTRIKSIFDSFLTGIVARRALYAFFTQCDGDNNTNEIIDGNLMYVDVYVQPTKVAEIIIFRTIITRTGASLAEVKIS
jgi:phage tail sheath protein FI